MKHNINDFIKWALMHVNPKTVPEKAALPIPVAECGAEPWHYLFGTTGTKTTQGLLEERFVNHYQKAMTRSKYNDLTNGWKSTDFATDCQGLADAYCTQVGEKTDINANMNYQYWCEDKGTVDELSSRPYIIGEAVFKQNKSTGKMTHVGFVCGFDEDGEVLIIEARGIEYGVTVTRFEDRPWTHRGLMTKMFDYESEANVMETIYEVTSPMKKGNAYLAMQEALNLGGYTDENEESLKEDGKWGNHSDVAFRKMMLAHLPEPNIEDAETHTITVIVDGETVYSNSTNEVKD